MTLERAAAPLSTDADGRSPDENVTSVREVDPINVRRPSSVSQSVCMSRQRHVILLRRGTRTWRIHTHAALGWAALVTQCISLGIALTPAQPIPSIPACVEGSFTPDLARPDTARYGAARGRTVPDLM